MNEWTRKLRDMGLDHQDLADLYGVHVSAVRQALPKGNTRYTTMIRALEIMTPEQRKRFLTGE